MINIVGHSLFLLYWKCIDMWHLLDIPDKTLNLLTNYTPRAVRKERVFDAKHDRYFLYCCSVLRSILMHHCHDSPLKAVSLTSYGWDHSHTWLYAQWCRSHCCSNISLLADVVDSGWSIGIYLDNLRVLCNILMLWSLLRAIDFDLMSGMPAW